MAKTKRARATPHSVAEHIADEFEALLNGRDTWQFAKALFPHDPEGRQLIFLHHHEGHRGRNRKREVIVVDIQRASRAGWPKHSLDVAFDSEEDK